MQRCANSVSSGGPWCILGNNALDSTQTGSFVYNEINVLYAADPTGTAVAFQMNSSRTSEACQAVAVAVADHGQSIEFWPPTGSSQGFVGESPSTLAGWGNDLADGTAPTCS